MRWDVRRMRRLLVCLLVLCLAAVPALAELQHQVRYFYTNYCEQCDPDETFAEEFHQLTGFDLADCDYAGYNVVHAVGRAAYEAQLEALGLGTASLPMIVVDGVAYQGAGELNARLPEAALSWGSTQDSAIVYLYTPACESCARAAKVLEQLPASVSIKRGSFAFESAVTVEKIDASANMALADALFAAYDVPDEGRITPIVFFADRYLSGADAIEKSLIAMVELGWAAGGVKVDTQAETEIQPPQVMAWTVTIGSGLVAGLNTCALSMLLLLLSLLLELRKHRVACAVCFLAAKFCCYLLIGFALLGVLQQFNPVWIKPLARTLLTMIGCILIGMNLWDAWQAKRMAFGKIRNQLPTGLRKLLHGMIRRLTSSRVVFPSVILLGFLVALGEFLCAGQLYLMRLLNALESGGTAAMHLVAYCAAFIVPSAVLCALVLGGRSQAKVSAFFAQHMTAAKLLTAAAMLILIVTAWLM